MPWAQDAVALRRWDDAAKVPNGAQMEIDDVLAVDARFRGRA
ncbi:hypothetical protein [Vulcanimicrobium alpinum]|nr:hypothetical protein [Vulcanimicrobium alpinum]